MTAWDDIIMSAGGTNIFDEAIDIRAGATLVMPYDFSAYGSIDFTSGYTALCRVRDGRGESVLVAPGTSGATATLTATAVTLRLEAALTATLGGTAGCQWELEISKTSTSETVKVAHGQFRVRTEVADA